MIKLKQTSVRPRGFSLLEVMIAVVVLATGLLALAALQGSLTRSSAEAKVRGRVAAMLSARMDELRSNGYDALVDGSTTTTSTTDPCDGDATDWIDCTRAQAGLASLTSVQTVQSWSGAGSFTPTVPTDTKIAQFRRVSLTASWADALGANHQLATASDISPLSLSNSLVPPPDDVTSGGGGPVVRTTNPATAGVIPIALGNGNSSAASNPTPELVGQQNNQHIVGTKFNVLTYTPSGSEAVIQKRFENEIVKCSCQYGAGGTHLPAIYQTAQWPAIWTGDRYELFQPSPTANAPGQALSSGPRAGVEQSPVCQECCRDHHDTNATGVAKFDPERFNADGSTAKYNLNGVGALVTVPDTSSATYVNACRVIRVDGFWRTASDMYSRQFGLLETQSVGGVRAKNGLPTDNATAAYTSFVKNYLKLYDGTVGTAPAGAQTLFDATANINDPSLITITAPSTTDTRYLHGRGLYVDYLESKARTRLTDVLADNGPQGRCPTALKSTHPEDCVLPYLPFTSANLTEIAKWVASNPNVLNVNTNNLLDNPSLPSGGSSTGIAAGTADNTATARKSNSGVAINTEAVFANVNGVDPTDDSDVGTDRQSFQVGGTGNTGGTFLVSLTGGGLNPFVYYTIGADSGGPCPKPGANYSCATNSALPQAGSIRLSNYWIETTTARSTSATCTDNQGALVSASDTIAVPTFRNYAVTAASVGGTPAITPYVVGGTDGTKTETTTISFGSIPTSPAILITLTEQGGSPAYATVASCTTNGGHNQINDIVWTKPWESP